MASNIVLFAGFGHVLLEVAEALAPLLIVFIFFQFYFLKIPWEKVSNIMVGMLLAFLGLAFFLQGVKVGFMPTGRLFGEQLGQLPYNWIAIPIGMLLGLVATAAEPAVRILNYEVEKVSNNTISQRTMLFTLAIGVAFSIGLAMVRILYGISLWYFLVPGYLISLIMIRYSSKLFVSVAFDSGGVATGPMTVTFISAMAIGIATGIEGRDPLIEGFGMISLVALAPILSVLALGILYKERSIDDESGQGS